MSAYDSRSTGEKNKYSIVLAVFPQGGQIIGDHMLFKYTQI